MASGAKQQGVDTWSWQTDSEQKINTLNWTFGAQLLEFERLHWDPFPFIVDV